MGTNRPRSLRGPSPMIWNTEDHDISCPCLNRMSDLTVYRRRTAWRFVSITMVAVENKTGPNSRQFRCVQKISPNIRRQLLREGPQICRERYSSLSGEFTYNTDSILQGAM